MVHQGLIDNYEDYFVSAADLEEAQAPLKPSIRPPATKDCEQKLKYFGNLSVDQIWRTFKYTTQHRVLPPHHIFRSI